MRTQQLPHSATPKVRAPAGCPPLHGACPKPVPLREPGMMCRKDLGAVEAVWQGGREEEGHGTMFMWVKK